VGGGKNAGDRETLRRNGIKAVFDCACQYNVRNKVKDVCDELGVDYCGIPALDALNYPLLQHYDVFERFVSKHASSSSSLAPTTSEPKRNVLIICAEGVNRSCTLTACYLIATRHWPLQSVVDRIRSRRRVALTNMHFRFLMWDFACRKNLPLLSEEVPTPHVPMQSSGWSRNTIVELAGDVLKLVPKQAGQLLTALWNEAAEDAVWRQNVVYVAHEAITRQKCRVSREALVVEVLNLPISKSEVDPLIKIWNKNKLMSQKLLAKIVAYLAELEEDVQAGRERKKFMRRKIVKKEEAQEGEERIASEKVGEEEDPRAECEIGDAGTKTEDVEMRDCTLTSREDEIV